MAQKEDLKIKVGLENEASGPLKALAKDVKGFADEFKKSTPHVDGAAASILRFGTGVAVGNLATLAARKILQEFSQQIRNVISASNEMASAMIGLSSVAAAFGENQQEARDSAKSLAEDGLMAVSEAGEGLKNLLATGFNLEESITLMNTFKDAAAFNRQGTLEFGQAIVGATQGIKNQNSIMVDNVGITKNLSVILKEAGLSMQDLSRVSSDATVRMALYNGLLREGSIFAGDAARATMTLQGAQSTLTTAVFNLQAQIGQALTPALMLSTQALIGQVNAVGEGLGPMERMAKILVSLVTNLRALGLVIKTIVAPAFLVVRAAVLNAITLFKGFASVVFKILQRDFKGAVDAWVDTSWEMADRSKEAVGDIINTYEEFIPAWEKIGEEGAEVWRRIEVEGLKGFTDIARKALEELPPMLSDAAKKMIEQIRKEIKRFAKAMETQARNFKESMRDLVVSHKEKVENIKKQLEEEKEAFKDAADEIRDRNAEDLQQFKIAAQERLASLQRQLDKERAKGKKADQDKIANLEDMIMREKKSLEDQLKLKEELIEEEIEEELEKHQDKIDALQEELDTEMELQQEHADVFAEFKDAVAEDDIERLKRKFEEERALMILDHADRLAEIKKQVQAENALKSGGAGYAGTQPEADPNKLYSASELISMGYGGYAGWNNPEAGYNFRDTGGEGKWTGITLAEGGIITKPTTATIGEAGPEAVIPLTDTSRASQILEDVGIGRNVTIHAPITVVSNELDLDVLVERLAYKMKSEGMI